MVPTQTPTKHTGKGYTVTIILNDIVLNYNLNAFPDTFQGGSPPLASYRHIVRKFESHFNDPYSHSPLFTIIRASLLRINQPVTSHC